MKLILFISFIEKNFTIFRPQLCFMWLVKLFNFDVAKPLSMYLLNYNFYKANYAVTTFSCYVKVYLHALHYYWHLDKLLG
jgi:hypothetical protein